jgi:hypothetical protein
VIRQKKNGPRTFWDRRAKAFQNVRRKQIEWHRKMMAPAGAVRDGRKRE